MIDDLISWLLIQVADDGQAAEAATPGPWVDQPADSVYVSRTAVVVRAGITVGLSPTGELVWPYVVNEQEEGGEGIKPADAAHIARWNPARVLRLTAALVKILDEFSWEAREVLIVQELAEALYGDRPGYREEWRP